MSFLSADKIRYSCGSLFSQSEKTGLSYIDAIDVDRLLAPLFEVHSLPSPNNAERYCGWERRSGANWFDSPESFTLAGHSLGHFMSAVAKFFESTGDLSLKRKADYIVSMLDFIQTATSSGYIGGCNEDCFLRLFSGDADNWADGYWVPWYNVHKIYKGLTDIYYAFGSEKALTVLIRFADWAYDGLKKLTDSQFDKMLETEYGGMNEVFANLYEITGNSDYLDLAVKFTEKKLLDFLISNDDRLEGRHANTQIPKVIGMAAIYRSCPEGFPEYRTAAENFWRMVTGVHSYAIGGNSVGEHFESANKETLTPKTCESCNTYNMQRLTKYLYGFERKSEYFDWFEKALYNHILPQQDSESGAKMYFVSLLPAHHKTYEKKFQSWWCCTGTGMENPAKYKQAMFYEDGGSLYINLYSPCRFEHGGLEFEISTAYPYSDTIKIHVLSGKAVCDLKLRIPGFSEGAEVCVNAEKYTVTESGYLSLDRLWSQGDEITVGLNFGIKLYQSREADRFAYTYGPLTLAARLGELPESVSEYTDNELIIDTTVTDEPIIITDGSQLTDIPKPTDCFAHFVIGKENNTLNKETELVPFLEIGHGFYSVYLKHV